MATDQTEPRHPSSADAVDAALRAVRRFSRALWLDLVRRDQFERWQRGSRVAAEAYFRLLPELRDDHEDALVLICGEVHARRELGEEVLLPEVQRRFPELAEELAMQFQLDDALGYPPQNDAEPEYATPVLELPGFRILHEIGRGASGVVYLAHQISTDRLVAIKAIHASGTDASRLRRQRQEAAILSRMRHPNIVQIHDVIETNGMLCSIIEYVDGPTLAEFTEGKPLPPTEAARLTRVLAEAVHAVHEAGILHRDLKPSNVLLTSGGEPKITDFGLAKLLSNTSLLTTHHCVLGTPSYMSPEQATGDDRGVDRAGDVYSLGAILYELLTGRPPFLGVTILDTLSMIREREPVPPRSSQPRTPRDLETICLKCLAKSAQDRYRSAAALAEDLGRFLAGAPIQARRALWRERAARWCRRNPTIATLTASLLATGVIGFVGVVWQWRQAEHARQSESVARLEADQRAREQSQGLERLKLANGFLERGHGDLAERHWDDAYAAFTRAIELRPEHVQAWEARGEFLFMRLGLFDLAATDLARAFALQQPNSPHRWWWNALLRVYTGDMDGYRDVCARLKERIGESGSGVYPQYLVRSLALSHENRSDAQSMIALTDEMARCTPRQSDFSYLQALALLRGDRPQEAIDRCRESLSYESGGFCRELNYPVMALAHCTLGQYAEARAALDKATAILREWTHQRCQDGPDSWVVSLGAAAIWPVSCWDWLEFEVYLRQAFVAAGGEPLQGDPRWQVLRARALAGLRLLSEADKEYATALELSPDDVQVQLEAHRNRAYYLAKQKQFRRAADEFAQASRLSPDDTRLLGFRALAHLAAGDAEQYREVCAEMMRRFSKTQDPSAAHDIVDACTLRADSLPNMDELVGVGKVAATKYLGSIRVLGAAHFRAGHDREAIACFEEAAKFHGAKPWELAFRAMAYHRLGLDKQARDALAKAAQWIEQADHPDPDDLTSERPKWGGWYEKVHTPIIIGEARAMLEPTSPPGRH